MNMMTMNAESLSRAVGVAVSEIEVLIAKNDIAGLPPEGISEILGVPAQEVREIQESQQYRDIRLLLGVEHAKGLVATDFSWDTIEQMALENLVKRMPYEKDGEFNLRVAAVANKAQRRVMPNNAKILDPSQGAARVPLTLTSRIVKRLHANGTKEIEETRQISVTDGTAQQPSFSDIDSLLGVTPRPRIAEKMVIHTSEPDFSIDDIEFGGKSDR